jgi:hypothetical protein
MKIRIFLVVLVLLKISAFAQSTKPNIMLHYLQGRIHIKVL